MYWYIAKPGTTTDVFIKKTMKAVQSKKSEKQMSDHITLHRKHSDERGFGKPQGYKGKGKEGKGQGTNSMTLNKPLTLQKGQGFFRRVRSFLENCIPLISESCRSFIYP
jgi:hypothetical protein